MTDESKSRAPAELETVSDSFRTPSVSTSYPEVSFESGLHTAVDSVFVVLTQAYDRSGNSLVKEDGPQFDGFPGVTLWLETPDGLAGEVTLSPIHGDVRKACSLDIPPGTRCALYAMKGGPQLERSEPCECGGNYNRVYLTRRGERGEIVLICDIWGCYRSRIMDSSEVLSWIEY